MENGKSPIPSSHEINLNLHCAMCINDLASGAVKGISPKNYSALSIGFTPIGLQVWCDRHDCNVAHIDFQGQKHPANLNR